MKILLLITLLTAGDNTFRVSSQLTRRPFGNVFQCDEDLLLPMTEYNVYGCYCDYGISNDLLEDLTRCCQVRDNCRDQVKKLENCKFLIDNPYILYSYSCSGNEITCSGKNNTCEDMICNCDRQAAICSNIPYNKEHKGLHC